MKHGCVPCHEEQIIQCVEIYYSGNTEKEKDAAPRKNTAIFYRDIGYSVAGVKVVLLKGG